MPRLPSNSQYVAAVRDADNFSSLRPISTVKAGNDIKYAAGGFAIVFKMLKSDEQRHYAIKCFTVERPERQKRYTQIAEFIQQNSQPFLLNFRYLPSELWANLSDTEGHEYPVVAMP